MQGQPLNTGLFVDSTYDIGRVENVHWNPWFCTRVPFMRWQLTYGRAFVVARSDWEYFYNTFAFGYSIGYHFIQVPPRRPSLPSLPSPPPLSPWDIISYSRPTAHATEISSA